MTTCDKPYDENMNPENIMKAACGRFNWKQGFALDFSLLDGSSRSATPTIRRLSDVRTMYDDQAAADEILATANPVVYEFHELGAPTRAGDLGFGTSIVLPGKVGEEYFMTKGHFHSILETAKVYYCLAGQGIMLLESPEGDWSAQVFAPGQAVYVPPRYAHRSINTGTEKLVTFYTYRADAGHDYGTIESRGFRCLVVEQDGKPAIRPNRRWSESNHDRLDLS